CPVGAFGEKCASRCTCVEESSAICDHVTGACECMPGYTGQRCEIKCPDLYFGMNCAGKCVCELPDMIKKCDHVSGMCYCRPGRIGSVCNETCPDGYYGEGCLEVCACQNNATCEPANGCNCTRGFTGKYCE
ncbi:predicted protein, partial [Nematostella vectensis]